MTSYSSRRVRIFRDSFETPWGFRLQGGKDLNYPLTVQRVFSNSPAEGELQRGDIILSINGRDAGSLTHKQAQDQIKFGGGQIELVVNRPPPGPVHIKPLQPTSPTRAPSTHPLSGAKTAPVVIPIRRQSEPKMPPPQAIAGHQPKKITLNKYGGGTSSFGSSYTKPRGFVPTPSIYSEQYTPQPSMMMRQQDTYDSGTSTQAYSPQQQYQPPPQQSYQPPPQQQYQSPQQQYQPPQQQYQPPQQQYQPPQQPVQTPPASHPGMQQPDYVRSSDPIEEEDYEYIPVSQRKKQFVEPSSGPSRIRPKKAPPVIKPVAAGYSSFGTDYTKPQSPQVQPVQQRPPPPPVQQRPVNAAPDDMLQMRDVVDAPSPWSQTLRSSGGPKPWEHEGGEYVMPSQLQTSPKQRPPPKQPKPPKQSSQKITIRSVSNEPPADDTSGPKVVHLQYNSPMGLYSNANVQDTYAAQTQGRPGGSETQSTVSQPQPQRQYPGDQQQQQQGDRDWNQSYVYRMLQEQKTQKRQVFPPQQQQSPVVTQTYQSTQKTWTNLADDEVGVSEF